MRGPADEDTFCVLFVGSIEVLKSSTNFSQNERTLLAQECITRVAEAGRRIATRKRKLEKFLKNSIDAKPDLSHAGENVTLTIRTNNWTVTNVDSNEVLFTHLNASVSVASVGDQFSMDFVAYLARTDFGRRCYVFECCQGTTRQVLNAIEKAFKARLDTIKSSPREIRSDSAASCDIVVGQNGNDSVSAASPTSSYPLREWSIAGSPESPSTSPKPGSPMSPSTSPKWPIAGSPVSASTSPTWPFAGSACSTKQKPSIEASSSPVDETMYFRATSIETQNDSEAAGASREVDVVLNPVILLNIDVCQKEAWFHGRLNRIESESLIKSDGQFLVRQSKDDLNKLVLTGMHKGVHGHIVLIVDGEIRTKDRRFENVTNFIRHHRENNIPIAHENHSVTLKHPIGRQIATH